MIMALINENLLYLRLGKKIKALREKHEKSQEVFAAEIEVSRASLANYENGSQPVGVSTLYKIAALLGIKDINDLLPSVEEITTSLPENKIEKDSSLGKKQKAEVLDFMDKAPGGEKK